ncbi:MAG TPA: NfeD family protein [Phycisphaerae bacterium]|nr:NfeD family protein [Phycisphaerae bacterium]HUT59034.1 NfeD family protein [Phycisphaerae bacterium]
MVVTIAWIVLLVLAALVLLLFELITPTFGMLAGLALAALVGAVWLTFGLSNVAGVVMIVAIVMGVPAYVLLLVKVLPRMPVGRKLFLGRRDKATGEGSPKTDAFQALVGKTGKTETMLRPAGMIRIDGQRISATAESGIIEKDQPVKIISAGTGNVVVRKVY